MKVHITRTFDLNEEIIEKRQAQFAYAGHLLGMTEMGIRVGKAGTATDTEAEMSARLDGIIAAVEHDDLVIVQLPTGNSVDFELKLVDKIWAYSGRRALFIWQDSEYYNENREKFKNYINLEQNCFEQEYKSDIAIQSALLDMVAQAQRIEHPYYKADELTEDSTDIIHVAFGLHDKTGTYSAWVGTAIQSIIEHTDSEVLFHILHDETLTQDNKAKLVYVAKSGGQRIVFHNIDDSDFDEIRADINEDFTIGTMFRLILPELLKELPRIIYLDADMFVNIDIRELWRTDITGYCLGVVKDMWVSDGSVIPYPVRINQVYKENYFNAGMLYINLDNIRNDGKLSLKVADYLKNNKEAVYPDQDALNVIYNGKCLYLDNKWDYFVTYERGNKDNILKDRIYHYVGTRLILYLNERVDSMYYETMSRTPWGNMSCKEIADNSVGRIADREGQLKKLYEKLREKNRKLIFYGYCGYAMNNMMNILGADDKNSLVISHFDEKIFNNIDDYIILMSPDADDNNGIMILEEHGLKNGIDFFVIQRLLHMYQGGFI